MLKKILLTDEELNLIKECVEQYVDCMDVFDSDVMLESIEAHNRAINFRSVLSKLGS